MVVLPAIALAERVRRGLGRRVALRAIRIISAVLGVRWEIDVDPAAAAEPHAVLVPNHRSPLDIPALLLARPQARFVAAAELFRIPLLAGAMRALDTTPVDRRDARQSHAKVDAASQAAPQDLVVFAEGGIFEGPLAPLRSGAFRIAISAGLPVLPVAITGSGDVLGPHRRLLVRPGTIGVRVGAPNAVDGLGLEDRDQLRGDVRDALEALLDGSGQDVSVKPSSRSQTSTTDWRERCSPA